MTFFLCQTTIVLVYKNGSLLLSEWPRFPTFSGYVSVSSLVFLFIQIQREVFNLSRIYNPSMCQCVTWPFSNYLVDNFAQVWPIMFCPNSHYCIYSLFSSNYTCFTYRRKSTGDGKRPDIYIILYYTQNKTGVEICRGGIIFQNDATQLRGCHIGPICHNGNILVPMGTISFKILQSCFLLSLVLN